MTNRLEYNDIKLIDHLKELFPICRSLTGEGTRKTLEYFEDYHKEYQRLKFNSGSKVLDWEIPKEWNIKDAYIENIDTKEKYAEFKKDNLHVVGYSEPVNKEVSYEELLTRIHTLEDKPEWIPYVTSYYKKYWGFCMSELDKKSIKKGRYRVYIDSTLSDGKLELSHALIKGKSEKEILFSSYICHPSMANNELSGPVVLNALLAYVKKEFKTPKYSYRFIMQPETIGSIAYLSKYADVLKKRIICGFNLSCVGDERNYSYVNTPFANTLADFALRGALNHIEDVNVYSFLNRGSDERQYCSPGLRLPICTFSRTKFGCYPEYHTNADNLNLVTNKGLNESYEILKSIVMAFETGIYPKTKIIGEPQLGKRGLYPNISKASKIHPAEMRMNLIAYSDGNNNIFDICKIINSNLNSVVKEYQLLKENDVLE